MDFLLPGGKNSRYFSLFQHQPLICSVRSRKVTFPTHEFVIRSSYGTYFYGPVVFEAALIRENQARTFRGNVHMQ